MHAVRDPSSAPSVAQTYADLVRGLPPADYDAVVLPERMFADSAAQVNAGSESLQDAANALHTRVIAGFDESSPDGTHRNTARVFAPSSPLKVYAKRRLIPGLESSLLPGKRSLIMGDRDLQGLGFRSDDSRVR